VLCLIDCYLFQDALADVRWAIAGWNESTDGWADRHKKNKRWAYYFRESIGEELVLFFLLLL
jgi:hypothetical protein